ncbi:MAG: NADH:flavin oxidoreductase [Peptoniphilus sp.]|nr:NADH:flavin oxidoreductase [Peptoniphilus sp.]MDD7362638.1 NADH:flavin oxidoreductase [Bacillota bacterium]MDY6044963.1 NADH:flavin oxidoreductase [Peptoniphilus sp.]
MERIRQSIDVGVRIPSRIVMPPMASEGSEDGRIEDSTIEFYKKHAENPHFGLYIVEHNYVERIGKASPKQMSLARDEDVEGHKRLLDAMRSASRDFKVFVQINHAGRKVKPESIDGEPIGPSAEAGVREMTAEDMLRVKDAFVSAALRAQRAGYDGVELHVAHGYLLNQFLSPLANKRSDEYGEDRLLYPLEVFCAIKEAVGNFPVAVRIGGLDFEEGGTAISDGVSAAKRFEEAGASLIDMTGGMNGFTRPGHDEPGWFSDLTEAVKKEVETPVLLTGGVKTCADAERLLKEGKADLIGVGRAFLKDPRWEMDE